MRIRNNWENLADITDSKKGSTVLPVYPQYFKKKSRPGTLRRRYDHQTQTTIFAPSQPNKRSREEIAEIDAELIRRANRIGGATKQ